MKSTITNFYDEWHSSAGNNRIQEIRDRDLMAIAALSGCETVFELGCGSGVILSMLPKNVKKYGVDISSRAIEIASTVNNISAKVVDIDREDLPYHDSTFDGCLASEVLEHLFDPVHALSECNRILKPGGKIIITIPNIGYYIYRHYHFFQGEVSDFHGNAQFITEHIRYYSVNSISKLLRITGYSDIQIQGVMKTVIKTCETKSDSKKYSRPVIPTLKYLFKSIRPTPINILSKLNRILSLWKRYPSLFAVGLVIEARKFEESKYKYNAAIDHQLRTSEYDELNIHHVD